MNVIRPAADRPMPHVQEVIEQQSVIMSVWSAVVEFFTYIAATVVEFATYCWTSVSEAFSSDEDCVTIIAERIIHPKPNVEVVGALVPIPYGTTLAEKLAPYQGMPRNSVQFLMKALNCYRAFLAQNDIRLARELQDKTGFASIEDADAAKVQIPKELRPEQAQIFWTGIEDLDEGAYAKAIVAAVRAYVFSGCKHRPDLFTKTVQYAQADRTVELQMLQERFNRLPNDQKELLVDYGNLVGVEVSEEAKQIFNTMMGIANDLLQSNQNFVRAFQGALTAIFPDE